MSEEIKFLSLSHARTVRDRYCKWAETDTSLDRIERWGKTEGEWEKDIDSLAQWIKTNWNGNGVPDWGYLEKLKKTIVWIAAKEREEIK